MIMKILNYFRKRNEIKRYGKICYSQEGEDILLERVIGSNKKKGFYIDIGAHHPIKFSNTFLFYLRGWNGINIDAMPNSMKSFDLLRPKDLNLEIPISDTNEILKYHIFNYPELNTFIEANVNEWNGRGDVKVIKTIELEAQSIDKILETYIKDFVGIIDILSIDVEGMDFKILKSINLEKYKIKFIIIEEGDLNINDILQGSIYKHLIDKKFQLMSKLKNSTIYINKQL